MTMVSKVHLNEVKDCYSQSDVKRNKQNRIENTTSPTCILLGTDFFNTMTKADLMNTQKNRSFKITPLFTYWTI